jgi:hypothetical protein
LNLDEVEPGATKLAPIGVAPKDAQKPIEDAMRWADSVRAAIGAESSHFLTVAGLGENSELPQEYRELGLDVTLRCGVTDAGLILLADRNECQLLTDGERLFSAHPTASRLEIRMLDEYLDEWA